jgi:hypothetical protein
VRPKLAPPVPPQLVNLPDAGRLFSAESGTGVSGVGSSSHACSGVLPCSAGMALFRSFAFLNSQVHEAMPGPTGFYDSGTLKGWDVTGRLAEITVPALITSDQCDITTPRQMQVLAEKIAGSRWGHVRQQRPTGIPRRARPLPSRPGRLLHRG